MNILIIKKLKIKYINVSFIYRTVIKLNEFNVINFINQSENLVKGDGRYSILNDHKSLRTLRFVIYI
jgi:hypothetical protein